MSRGNDFFCGRVIEKKRIRSWEDSICFSIESISNNSRFANRWSFFCDSDRASCGGGGFQCASLSCSGCGMDGKKSAE